MDSWSKTKSNNFSFILIFNPVWKKIIIINWFFSLEILNSIIWINLLPQQNNYTITFPKWPKPNLNLLIKPTSLFSFNKKINNLNSSLLTFINNKLSRYNNWSQNKFNKFIKTSIKQHLLSSNLKISKKKKMNHFVKRISKKPCLNQSSLSL